MRFSCSSANMASALNVVTRAIAARSTIPIMEGVSLTSCPDGLRMICTDLAFGIETHIEASFAQEGSVVLPGKLLNEIVRKLPEDMMDISVNEQNIASIRCAGSRTTLAGFSAEEYPALPDVGETETITLPQSSLKEMLQRTSFAIANDEIRPILTGCLLETEGNTLSVVALDGFRLALRKESFSYDLPVLSMVAPGKALNEVAKVLEDTEEPVHLSRGKTHLLADMGKTRVITRLLEGEFIRYRQILPTDYQTRVTVSKSDLEDAIDRASLMAREGKNNLVRMHIEDGIMLITSNAELGDVREEIKVQFEGKELEIAFNVRYISDTLRAIEDDEIVMRFNSNVSPCVVCPTEGSHFLYLALPVRVFTS